MKIEELKQGQAVWVKGYVDRSIFGERYGFINFYKKDGNNIGHISKNNAREMKEEDVKFDQPKPVVPQFMADWYEEHKDNFYLNLHRLAWELIENLDEDDFVPKKALDSDFKRWYHKTETAIQTLINMHQFGYTVEKEKVYQIIDKRLNATFSCLGYDIEDRVWFWGNKKFFLKNKGVRLAHTRQQLIDAGFEEVFENPNYEAEEVTEL